jgi:hypothetical protein
MIDDHDFSTDVSAEVTPAKGQKDRSDVTEEDTKYPAGDIPYLHQ